MNLQSHSTLKKSILAFSAIMMVLFFVSCSKNIAFQNSSAVPAAQGNVTVKKDGNKNYLIKIKISNLAEVNRLEPSRNFYVVWMETDEAMIKNIGQIKSDSGFMSSKLKAFFQTVSSFKPKKIFITAEDQADITAPGTQLILSTTKF